MRQVDADIAILLIQKDKIEGETLNIIKALGDGLQAETLNQACDRHIKIINSLPTIEAEPTKHGRWLAVKVMDDEADFGETDGAECSVCGYTTNSEYWAKTYYYYCPKCGARMDMN